MNDVREWMRGVEHEDPPDLWSTIQSRVPVRDPSPSDEDPGGQARGWKKMIVIATAAAITVAATGFVIFALRPTTPPHTEGVGQPQRWTFAPQDGWNVSESPLDPRASVLSAWTANVPFDDRDLPHVTGFPLESLRSLPEDGIVVTVLSPNPVASSPQPTESPSTSVPELSLPLHLQDGEVRGPIAEEPRRPLTVYEIRAIVDGDFLGVVAYLGTRNPSADLLASADAAVGRLTLGESVRDVPTLAALGSQELVVQEGDGTLYLADVDGSRLALLGAGHDPAWSPDGTQLAFREGPQRESGPPTKISVVNADGTGRRDFNLPASVGGEASGETGAPAWSPDGTEIVFASLRGIFVVDTDGSNLREVVHYTGTHACYDLEPTWSPDGETIAFAIVCDGESEGIWSVPAVGGAPTATVARRSGVRGRPLPNLLPGR